MTSFIITVVCIFVSVMIILDQFARRVKINHEYLVWCGCGCHRKLRKVIVTQRNSLIRFMIKFDDGEYNERSCFDLVKIKEIKQ